MTGTFEAMGYNENGEKDQASTSGEMRTTPGLSKAIKKRRREEREERRTERRAHLKKLLARLKPSS